VAPWPSSRLARRTGTQRKAMMSAALAAAADKTCSSRCVHATPAGTGRVARGLAASAPAETGRAAAAVPSIGLQDRGPPPLDGQHLFAVCSRCREALSACRRLSPDALKACSRYSAALYRVRVGAMAGLRGLHCSVSGAHC
jgi:hypothetical protein